MTTSLFETKSVHKLIGVDPILPSDDLEILSNLVKHAKIVGLGEPTHGQKEINQLRDRFTRYLVEHIGFRIVAVEDSAIKCRLVNDFIRYGHGTAASALSQQNFWTWRTKESLALIQWLREWNLAHKGDQVQLIGIDFQDIATPATELHRLLGNANVDRFDATLSEIGTIQVWGDSVFDDDTWRSHLTVLGEIRGVLETNQHINANERVIGIDCMTSLEQAILLWREVALSPNKITPARWNRRDEAMAVRAIAATQDRNRVVLWAQNGHLQTEPMFWMPEGAVTMGQILKAQLEAEYVVVSGMFGSGSYRGFDQQHGGLATADVGDPPSGTLDNELWRTYDAPALIVSLDSPDSALSEEQTTRWAGAAIERSEDMITPVRPARGANAIAFVREVTPSEPI